MWSPTVPVQASLSFYPTFVLICSLIIHCAHIILWPAMDPVKLSTEKFIPSDKASVRCYTQVPLKPTNHFSTLPRLDSSPSFTNFSGAALAVDPRCQFSQTRLCHGADTETMSIQHIITDSSSARLGHTLGILFLLELNK